MSPTKKTQTKWAVASVSLQDSFTDFMLSRQAMLCTKSTLSWYGKTAGKFLQWLEQNGVEEPSEITARWVRAFLATLSERGLADSTIHGNARAIKTFVRFLLREGYATEDVTFAMPRVEKKSQPTLGKEELKTAIRECKTARDKALVMFLVDTGTRRAELCALNWGDISIESGLVSIRRGKGKKARSVVMGLQTRRAMLGYRRECRNTNDAPVFQTYSGTGLSPNGLRSVLLRIGERAGVKLSPHILRRTFATLSLRHGMNLLHLSALMGHSDLSTTERYVQTLDADLAESALQFSPVDRL